MTNIISNILLDQLSKVMGRLNKKIIFRMITKQAQLALPLNFYYVRLIIKTSRTMCIYLTLVFNISIKNIFMAGIVNTSNLDL